MATNIVAQFRNGLKQIFSRSESTITYYHVIRTRDADDNPAELITPEQTQAVVQIMRLEDIQEYGGLLSVGDAIIFFDNEFSPAKEDRIVSNNITYRIIETIPEYVGDNLIFTQTLCKREKYKPQFTNYAKTLSDSIEFTDALSY